MTASKGLRRSAKIDKANIVINKEKAALTAGATAIMGQDFPAVAMTDRPTTREIIDGTQAIILQALRNASSTGGLSQTEIYTSCGIFRTQMTRAMTDLRERELVVELTPRTGLTPIKWGASRQGCRAFFDYLRQAQRMADREAATPAPTYNTHGTQYHPPSNVYYRNNGNTHIASHGVRC